MINKNNYDFCCPGIYQLVGVADSKSLYKLILINYIKGCKINEWDESTENNNGKLHRKLLI